MKPTSPKPKKSALAKRAEAAAAAKLERVRKSALADIALIKRRLARVREDFFDVGEALARLKKKGVAEALGQASFHGLCEAKLGMSGTQADDLVKIATRISRDQALEHDRTRASALLALADATPADDLDAVLAGGEVELPGVGRVHVGTKPTADLLVLAKNVRAEVRGKQRGRGRTTTPKEREAATALEARLHRAGVGDATVRAVATKPGQPCVYRLDGLDAAALAVVHAAFARSAKRRADR